ncbi:MAG: hypothetical protein KME54_12000 [Tolypothrix brevis GSE-NOS-MK-07-07A]|nr:hypothetical protein [Tolypothrix brevis GSE-NOS-MK-07-07A]
MRDRIPKSFLACKSPEPLRLTLSASDKRGTRVRDRRPSSEETASKAIAQVNLPAVWRQYYSIIQARKLWERWATPRMKCDRFTSQNAHVQCEPATPQL